MSMLRCTWEGCNEESVSYKRAKDGAVWAYLCEQHEKKFAEAIASPDIKLMLSAWVKAQGGAKKATKRL